MGFWREVGKVVKQSIDPFGVTSDIYHNVTGVPTAAQNRERANEVNGQIKAYKDQTELTRQELATKKDEVNAEKRRVEEKQIRHLRRSYRPAGFLGNQAGDEAGMNSKLGD